MMQMSLEPSKFDKSKKKKFDYRCLISRKKLVVGSRDTRNMWTEEKLTTWT